MTDSWVVLSSASLQDVTGREIMARNISLLRMLCNVNLTPPGSDRGVSSSTPLTHRFESHCRTTGTAGQQVRTEASTYNSKAAELVLDFLFNLSGTRTFFLLSMLREEEDKGEQPELLDLSKFGASRTRVDHLPVGAGIRELF